ncbi:MAG TPA: hypothetical protein P5077_11225 [bacterium]|nr:hypothetical protein [bacterium]
MRKNSVVVMMAVTVLLLLGACGSPESPYYPDDVIVLPDNDGKTLPDSDKLVNDDGQLINDDGQLINDDGQLINDDGQVIGDSDTPVGDSDTPVGDGDTPVGDNDSPAGDSDIPVGDNDTPILPDDDTPAGDNLLSDSDDIIIPDVDTYCDPVTTCNDNGTCQPDGSCLCDEGYQGTFCDACDDGYVGYPDCFPCDPSIVCTDHGTCQDDGSCACFVGYEGSACDGCSDGYVGYPDCYYQACIPGTRKCNGLGTVQQCNTLGTLWADVETCSAGSECFEGNCLNECQLAEAKESYVGCEYWGAFLQNVSPDTYAVVVANPNDTAVTVTVYGNGNVQLAQFTVNAGALNSQTFDTTRHLTGPGIFNHAFKVVASRPVTVTQMNPFGNVLTYTNDATLLLPKGALGLQYYAMSWPDWHYYEEDGCDEIDYNYPGYVTVIATEPGTTSVTVKYSAATRAGTGVVAQAAGSTAIYSLNQYQVLNLNSAGPGCGDSTCYGADLTGSFIEADKRVAVFGGHMCTYVPAGSPACDHLEHQILPLRSWGMNYAAVRTKPRGSEADYWKILAAQDGTSVSWSGGVTGSVTLNAGQAHQLSTTADFVVTADKPILLAQILASQDAGAGTGDPALMLTAPNEQFRKDYIFLVAPNYDYDRLTIVAQADTNITLDSTSMSSNTFTAIAGTSWRRQYVDTADGAHKLTADKPVGLYVYGFSQYVSYAYTAGLDLVEIYSCWDLNSNGTCDIATEDLSGDGVCNERDC